MLVVCPAVEVTTHGDRMPVSKSPFEMMGPVHDAAGGLVDDTVGGERFGTTATSRFQG